MKNNLQSYPVYGRIEGPIVIIGFGSIGKGIWPLIERHFDYDTDKLIIIEPDIEKINFLKQHNLNYVHQALTSKNYKTILGNLLEPNKGFCINLSVDISSLDIMRFCRELRVPYIDAEIYPWDNEYPNLNSTADITNYALRQTIRDEKKSNPGGSTAIICCGANPGMVSWFVKEALLILAQDLEYHIEIPKNKFDWAHLMKNLGIKGIHIAERDTQITNIPKNPGTFVNTWSVNGFISEALQPAELGWGTHEPWFPDNGNYHSTGCQSAIWLNQPGGLTQVHTWCPTYGPQFGFLITHNESISIADYYTIGEGLYPNYRPTCHYAYHPCNDAVLSLNETFSSTEIQKNHHILTEMEIVDGFDELGVLLYGHKKNALWLGSHLSNAETRNLIPYQNATGLQVTSAILAGMVWALENPNAGIVEADEMDHVRCLEIQRPYLGSIEKHYTDWTPLESKNNIFSKNIDINNPWSFRNILIN